MALIKIKYTTLNQSERSTHSKQKKNQKSKTWNFFLILNLKKVKENRTIMNLPNMDLADFQMLAALTNAAAAAQQQQQAAAVSNKAAACIHFKHLFFWFLKAAIFQKIFMVSVTYPNFCTKSVPGNFFMQRKKFEQYFLLSRYYHHHRQNHNFLLRKKTIFTLHTLSHKSSEHRVYQIMHLEATNGVA